MGSETFQSTECGFPAKWIYCGGSRQTPPPDLRGWKGRLALFEEGAAHGLVRMLFYNVPDESLFHLLASGVQPAKWFHQYQKVSLVFEQGGGR